MSNNLITMDKILKIFKESFEINNSNNKKTNKRLEFIKETNKVSDKIIEIIEKYYTNNNNVLMELDNIFGCDINKLKYQEIIFLIQNIDDISSILLLLTALFSNYVTLTNYKLDINKVLEYYNRLNFNYITKCNGREIYYDKKKMLKDITRIKTRIINKNYKQCKYIIKCFSLFVLIPTLTSIKYNSFSKKMDLENIKFNKINKELIDEITDYFTSNQYVYHQYKKTLFKQNINCVYRLKNMLSKIGSKITKFLLDIFNIIYFISFGMNSIDKEIELYEQTLDNDYKTLTSNTYKILNIINKSKIIPTLIDVKKNNGFDDFDLSVKNEINFSKSTSNYIIFTDKYISKIIHNYTQLHKYLYNEKDLLKNIRK